MWHEIPPSADPIGSGVRVDIIASALRARGAHAADTFAKHYHGTANIMRRNAQLWRLPQQSEQKERSWSEPERLWTAVRSIINVNAYAHRRASPGGNPGRSRNREHDRGV
jgi:uncharacterized caspase-like protein